MFDFIVNVFFLAVGSIAALLGIGLFAIGCWVIQVVVVK